MAFEKRRREKNRKNVAKYITTRKKAIKKNAQRVKRKARKEQEQEKARAKAKADRKAAKRAARAQAKDDHGTDEGEKIETKVGAGDNASKPTNDADEKTQWSDGNKAEELQTASNDSKEEEAYVTAAEDIDKEATAKEKHVKIEDPLRVTTEPLAEGSVTSTEPGDDQHTPTSSTASSKTQTNGEVDEDQVEQLEDDEAYVTAAEDDLEKQPEPDSASGEPSTPKSFPRPAATTLPLGAHFADACVQTDTYRHPTSPHRRSPPPCHRERQNPPKHHHHPPPRHHYGLPSPPPPPPPSPPLDHPPPPPSPEDDASYIFSDVSSSDSDLDVDDNVSEVSDGDIDQLLEEDRRARQAAAVAAVKAARSSGGRGGGSSPILDDDDDDPLDEFEKDPWNAVGVFGLRVYYKMPADGEKQEAGVTLRVERPSPYVWDDSSDEEEDEQADDEKEGERKEESQVLDVDDSAKDAVGETPPTPGVELLKQLKKGGPKAGDDGDDEKETGEPEHRKEGSTVKAETQPDRPEVEK